MFRIQCAHPEVLRGGGAELRPLHLHPHLLLRSPAVIITHLNITIAPGRSAPGLPGPPPRHRAGRPVPLGQIRRLPREVLLSGPQLLSILSIAQSHVACCNYSGPLSRTCQVTTTRWSAARPPSAGSWWGPGTCASGDTPTPRGTR